MKKIMPQETDNGHKGYKPLAKPIETKESKCLKRKGKRYQKNANIREWNNLVPGFNNIKEVKESLQSKRKEMKEKRTHLCWKTEGSGLRLVLSDDNKYLVASFLNKNIEVYDFQMKKLVCSFWAHERYISGLAISKDNKYIVSGSGDKSIKIFELETGKEIYHFEDAHKFPVMSVAISNDNKYIISGSADSTIKIFDFESKQLVHHFSDLGHGECIVVTNDNKYFIAGFDSGSIRIFDLETKQLVHHFENVHKSGVKSVAISSEDKYIVSGSMDKSIKVFDFETKQEVYHFIGVHTEYVYSVAISRDNKYIISGSGDKSIKIFDFETKEEVYQFEDIHDDNVKAIVVSNDNRYIISTSSDKTIKILNFENPREVHHFENAHEDIIRSVAISSNNKYIVSGADDQSIKIFDFETKEELYEFKGAHQGWLSSVVISSDDKYIISASFDNTIKIFDLEMQEEVHHFKKAHTSEIETVAISNDNKYIVSGSRDKAIKIFDLDMKQEVYCFKDIHQESVESVVISSDNKYIISGSRDHSIKVFDLKTKEEVYHFIDAFDPKQTYGIARVAISNDNKYIVAGAYDVKIFDFETKQEVCYFKHAHTDWITSLVISKDNKYIISSSQDRSIKIFDLETKKEIYAFNDLGGNCLASVVLSNDNKYIVAGFHDHSIKVLNFPFNTTEKPFFISSKLDPYMPRHYFNKLELESSSCEYNLDDIILYKDICCIPHNWTTLHFLAIFQNFQTSKIANWSQFKVPFLVDKYGNTPLHYLIMHETYHHALVNTMFAYILDYYEDENTSEYERQRIVDSLTNLFSFIIAKINPTLVNRFLKDCFAKSNTIHNYTLPLFRKHKSTHIFTKANAVNPEIEQKMCTQDGYDHISFKSSMLHWDYSPHSEDMFKNMLIFADLNSEEFFRLPIISNLINYLWNKTKVQMWITALIFSFLMTLLSVYIGTGERIIPLEAIIVVLTSLFLGSEFIQMYTLGKTYIKSIWNWIDLVNLCLIIAFIITRFTDSEDELARGWMITIIIIIGYTRWASYLRILSPTRHLIQLILSTFHAILSFIVVLALIIVGFSLIFLEFERESGGYIPHLYSTYKLLYADFDDSGSPEEGIPEYSSSQKIILAFILFIFNVFLLNMLISIMGNAFGEVQQGRVVIDSLTKVNMILESQSLLQIFKRIRRSSEKGYLITCQLENQEEERETDLKDIGKVGQEVKQEVLQVKQEMEKIKGEVDDMREEMRKELKCIKDKMEENNAKLLKALNKEN